MIAHLNYFPHGIDIGIYNKLKVKSEIAIKHNIKIFFYVISNYEEDVNQNFKIIKCDTTNKFELKFFRYKVIERNFDFSKFNRIILRYPKCVDFSSGPFIRKYGHKIFTEHHALEVEEIRILENDSLVSKMKVFLEKINRVNFLNQSRGIIGVTNHIIESKKELMKIPKPTFLFSNGNLFQEILNGPRNENVYKLLFISGTFIQPWAGLDRLLLSLEKYEGSKKIELTLIGHVTTYQSTYIEKLNLKYNISIECTGQLMKKYLKKYYIKADACFGSLSPHKSDSLEACALKVREALSYGKPIIYAGVDTDIKVKVDWALNIDADDNLINIYKLTKFLDFVKSNPRLGFDIKDFFESNISWIPKLKRLEVFCSKN